MPKACAVVATRFMFAIATRRCVGSGAMTITWRAKNSARASCRSCRCLLWGLRKWDLRAAQQPNYYIANSRLVAERIRKIYGREAYVIPPPIEVNRFHMSNDIDDYYLVLSRLMPYKRIDLAIEACKRMNRRLVIIGDGPDRARLEKLADDGSNFSAASRTRSLTTTLRAVARCCFRVKKISAWCRWK